MCLSDTLAYNQPITKFCQLKISHIITHHPLKLYKLYMRIGLFARDSYMYAESADTSSSFICKTNDANKHPPKSFSTQQQREDTIRCASLGFAHNLLFGHKSFTFVWVHKHFYTICLLLFAWRAENRAEYLTCKNDPLTSFTARTHTETLTNFAHPVWPAFMLQQLVSTRSDM